MSFGRLDATAPDGPTAAADGTTDADGVTLPQPVAPAANTPAARMSPSRLTVPTRI
jgi:hypothetical protein